MDSNAAIQPFIGSDCISTAICYEEDDRRLELHEPKVGHYELAAGDQVSA